MSRKCEHAYGAWKIDILWLYSADQRGATKRTCIECGNVQRRGTPDDAESRAVHKHR